MNYKMPADGKYTTLQHQRPSPLFMSQEYQEHENRLLLTQPYQPGPSRLAGLENELLIPIPELTLRRGRRTALTTPQKNAQLEKVFKNIQTAILDSTYECEPTRIIDDIHNEHFGNMIEYATLNIEISRILQVQEEFRAYYYIGHGLNIAIGQEIMHQAEQHDTWTTIGKRMKLSAHQVKVARRVYEMFKLWPRAISHLKNLMIRDIAQMSNEQSQ